MKNASVKAFYPELEIKYPRLHHLLVGCRANAFKNTT